MAFLESDRVQIRQYLGFGALFLQLDNRLESAINSIQSIADGGTRPDSSSEVALKAIVTKLQSVDSAIDAISVQQGAHEVDEIKLDSARETLRLRMVGRQYVGRLARMLDTAPRSDCFATVPTLYGPDPRSGY
jgi:hypothetical protein